MYACLNKHILTYSVWPLDHLHQISFIGFYAGRITIWHTGYLPCMPDGRWAGRPLWPTRFNLILFIFSGGPFPLGLAGCQLNLKGPLPEGGGRAPWAAAVISQSVTSLKERKKLENNGEETESSIWEKGRFPRCNWMSWWHSHSDQRAINT